MALSRRRCAAAREGQARSARPVLQSGFVTWRL